jgi:two-component system KDP operon response regulator KdpE
MNPQGKILIVDDNAADRRNLHGDLYAAGFGVTDVEYPEEALGICRIMQFDVVLVSVNIQATHAVQICRSFHTQIPRAAILVLSESDDSSRKVEVLEAGADDCLVKPFHMEELIARIRATLRRLRTWSNRFDEIITIGEIDLDPGRHMVSKSGEPVHLTPKEFSLLHHLMLHAGLPVTHASLLNAVWGPDHVDQVAYLRTFMRQLRIKLDDDANPRYLFTDSYIGYHFVEPAMAPKPQ